MGLKNFLEKEREGRKPSLGGGDWKWFCSSDTYFKCFALCRFLIAGLMVWFTRVCFSCLHEVCPRCRNIHENSCKHTDFLFIHCGCMVFEWITLPPPSSMTCGRSEYSKSLLIAHRGHVIWLPRHLAHWNWNRAEQESSRFADLISKRDQWGVLRCARKLDGGQPLSICN